MIDKNLYIPKYFFGYKTLLHKAKMYKSATQVKPASNTNAGNKNSLNALATTIKNPVALCTRVLTYSIVHSLLLYLSLFLVNQTGYIRFIIYAYSYHINPV